MARLTHIVLSFLLLLINNVAGGKLSLTDTLTWGEDNSRSGYSPYVHSDWQSKCLRP